MGKVKREQVEDAQSSCSSGGSVHEQPDELDEHSQAQLASQQPARKKPKSSLNFSIDSIMQSAASASQAQQQQPSLFVSQLQLQQQQQLLHQHQQQQQQQQQQLQQQRSPASISGSSAGSRPASAANSRCSSEVADELERRPRSESPASLSGSSRASTPISPGFAAGSPGQLGGPSRAGASNSAAALAISNFQQMMGKQRALGQPLGGLGSPSGAHPHPYQAHHLQQHSHQPHQHSPQHQHQHQHQQHQQQQQPRRSQMDLLADPFALRKERNRQPTNSQASATTNTTTSSKQPPNSISQQAGQASTSTGATAKGADSRLAQVECSLDNKDMWDKFHSLNTEMIITKTGRRMFPVMKVQFHNLDPNARYAVSMDIVPVDNKRYRYAYHKSCWQVAGKADPSAEPRLYPHPDSPFNGDLLARQVISFEKVKLTNNEMDKSGHIILNSMHKYQPRVHLIELKTTTVPTNTATSTTSAGSSAGGKSSTSTSDLNTHNTNHHSHYNHNNNNNNNHQQQQAPQLDIEGYRTFVFPETVFTAVTAYQNQLITKMKIDKNPFAKGFRDSSRLSDLDRNDPFDYMGSLGPSGRFMGQPGPGGPPGSGSLEAASAAAAAAVAAGAHMDAYQLLASAANSPWYSAAAMAAASATGAGPPVPNPFGGPMGAPPACNSAQASQLQAQMWLAAFSAYLNGGAGPAGPPTSNSSAMGGPPGLPAGLASALGTLGPAGMLPGLAGPSPHLAADNGPDSGGHSSSSSANSSGTSA